MTALKSNKVLGIIEWVCRLLLGGAFIYAGLLKSGDPSAFAGNIVNFQLLPEAWVNITALSLPWLEIFSGLLILIGPWTRLGALSLAVLNGIFLLALLSALMRGISVDCGCFGSSGPSSPAKIGLAIARDLVFVAMAIFIYIRAARRI